MTSPSYLYLRLLVSGLACVACSGPTVPAPDDDAGAGGDASTLVDAADGSDGSGSADASVRADAGSSGLVPPGIPMPPFGLTDECPTSTIVRVGSGALPPASVAAGTTVVLEGTRAGEMFVTLNGAPGNPACLQGAPGSTWTSGGLEIAGQYGIVERLTTTGGTLTGTNQGHHLVFRDLDMTGLLSQTNTAGLFIGAASDVLVYRSNVRRFGNRDALADEDAQCFSVGRGATRVWFLENEASLCSGDGFNVNPYPYADAGLYTSIRYIYFGRNRSHDHKQTGFWVKGSSDIILSENECYGIRPSDSSYGQCMGYQYGTTRYWAIDNVIRDSFVGIGLSGSNGTPGEPVSRDVYAVRNHLSNIMGTGCGGGAFECAALYLQDEGGITYHLVGNTGSMVSIGINSARGGAIRHVGNTGLPFSADVDPGRLQAENAESVYAEFEQLYGLSIRP